MLLGSALAAGGAAAVAPTAAAIVRRRKPNILLVMTDQERGPASLPGALDLPAHDWLRNRGVTLENFTVNTTPCSPSRSTIYFGRHTQQTGMIVNLDAPPFPELNPSLRSIGHHLAALGYYTAYKGKWHLSDVREGAQLGYGPYRKTDDALNAFGFHDYNMDGDHHGKTWDGYRFDGPTVSDAIVWLNETARGLPASQPWFLAVNLVNPHDICFFESWRGQSKARGNPNVLAPLAPSPTSDIYAKDWSDIALPPSFHHADARGEPWAVRSYRELVDVTYGALPKDEAVWRRNQSYYFNCIRDASYKVASLFRALEISGYGDNTIIVYTADHGEMGGAQRLRQKGPVVYRENVNVPFMVVHPDIAAPRTTAALGTAVDILPTLYAFAGGRASDLHDPLGKLPGVDLGTAIGRSGGASARDARGAFHNYAVPFYVDPEVTKAVIRNGDTPGLWSMFWEAMKLGQFGVNLHNRAFHRGVFDGRYKFARFFAPAQHHIPRDWETLTRLNDLVLYDTEADPYEMHNLAMDGLKHKDLILALNRKTNALIAEEIGIDDGREQPGPGFLYRL